MSKKKEHAKAYLKKCTLNCDVNFRGVPLLEFDKQELVKIIVLLSHIHAKKRII